MKEMSTRKIFIELKKILSIQRQVNKSTQRERDLFLSKISESWEDSIG